MLVAPSVARQGEEWHRHRTVLSKKLLRPKEVHEYIAPMNVVSNDFMTRLTKIRNSDATIPNMDHEIFKWAMEGAFNDVFSPFQLCALTT